MILDSILIRPDDIKYFLFLKDKTVPVNGKEQKVLDIIGAN